MAAHQSGGAEGRLVYHSERGHVVVHLPAAPAAVRITQSIRVTGRGGLMALAEIRQR